MERYENLQELRDNKEQLEKELEQLERQYNRSKNRLEYRVKLKRKERTHQLIVIGAIMEQYFPELSILTEEQMGEVLHNIDHDRLHDELLNGIDAVRKEESE